MIGDRETDAVSQHKPLPCTLRALENWLQLKERLNVKPEYVPAVVRSAQLLERHIPIREAVEWIQREVDDLEALERSHSLASWQRGRLTEARQLLERVNFEK